MATPPPNRRSSTRWTRASNLGQASSVAGTPSSVGSTSSSTVGSRPGLPNFVVKQLATDIQRECGGPKQLKGPKALQKLLDRNNSPDGALYGPVGSSLRTQISNKVNKWKLFTKDEWRSKVLLKLGIPEKVDSSRRTVEVELSSISSADEEEPELDNQLRHHPVPSSINTAGRNLPAANKRKVPHIARKNSQQVEEKNLKGSVKMSSTSVRGSRVCEFCSSCGS